MIPFKIYNGGYIKEDERKHPADAIILFISD